MAVVKQKKLIINNELGKEILFDGDHGSLKKRKTRNRSSAKSSKGASLSADIAPVEFDQISRETIEIKEKLPLSLDQIYSDLLMSRDSVTPVDGLYQAFLVQDFHTAKSILKDVYVVVERKAFKRLQDYIWIYTCSCNKARERLIKSLPNQLPVDYENNLEETYEECLHIISARSVIEKMPSIPPEQAYSNGIEGPKACDHSYGKPKKNVTVYGIPDNNTVACVRWEEEDGKTTFHIIRVSYASQNPELFCCSCRLNNCMHCKEVLNQDINASDIPGNIREALNENISWRSRYVPVSVSRNSIPFSCKPEEQKLNRASIHCSGEYLHLHPDDLGFCSCGREWISDTFFLEEVKIFTENNILQAKVYARRCANEECQNFKEYDGCIDQILNMGTYMIAHSVLRSYMRNFLTQGCTMASFYKQWCWQQVDSGNLNFVDECPYNRYAWYCFANLLDISYEEGFICPECGDCPEIVVMDGVTLGLQRNFMPFKPDFHQNDNGVKVFDGSTHNTRIFINDKETRQLLKNFAENGINKDEIETLLANLKQHQPSLFILLDSFLENSFYIYKAPNIYKDFLKLLSSNYPVCGYLHYNEYLFHLLNNCDAFHMQDILLIEKEFPVLSCLFKNLEWKIPDNLKPVLHALIDVAKAPFVNSHHDLPSCSITNCNNHGKGFFPGLHPVCDRGSYVLDSKVRKKVGVDDCSKKSPSHPSLTPGLFTISCIHGICYGYDIMEDPESPNTAFTILRTRFKKAPKVIIYDNACNLHNYCLNRDPGFFRDSWFVVDRFHWCNHKGCHSGYNLSLYPQYRHLNTQVAEQRNATFKKLKSMLSYMNLNNFKMHINLYIWFRSMLSIASTWPDLCLKDFDVFKQLSRVYSNTV